jgi:hypothetical protein
MGRVDEDAIGRRDFLASSTWLGASLAAPIGIAGTLRGARAAARLAEHASAPRAYPQHDPDRVRAVVGASHGNLDTVRSLVGEQPSLAKASWDWGFGDWESALGAASHTGRREIADFLIAHGARPTVFSAAMIGQVDVVRRMLTADPSLFTLPGPHGISLTRHAVAGGDRARPVVDYLLDAFGPDESEIGHVVTDADESRYAGRYDFDAAPPFAITVAVGGPGPFLLVGAGERPTSRVLRSAQDVFHPTGAPAVRLRFDVQNGRADALTIEDGPVTLTGRRAATP